MSLLRQCDLALKHILSYDRCLTVSVVLNVLSVLGFTCTGVLMDDFPLVIHVSCFGDNCLCQSQIMDIRMLNFDDCTCVLVRYHAQKTWPEE